MPAKTLSRLAFVLIATLGLTLAACSPSGGLAPGLTARMDASGAHLDADAALGIINHLRASRGVPALTRDTTLEASAQMAASAYQANGTSPKRPDGAAVQLTSAGYLTFAETFSGWRSSEKDATTLSDAAQRRAGVAVAASPTSEFGTYWVLLMAP